MTVLAAICKDGEASMSSDTKVSMSYVSTLCETKVYRKGAILIGASGLYAGVLKVRDYNKALCTPEGGLTDSHVEAYINTFVEDIKSWAESQDIGKKDSTVKVFGTEFLFATRVGVWFLASDLTPVKVSGGWFAHGSGYEIALGSLHATQEVSLPLTQKTELACRAAIQFNSGCGGDVKTLSLPPVYR